MPLDKDVLATIKAEMGTAAAPVIARMEASEEKVRRIEEMVAELRKSPSTAPIADAYDAALANGTPHNARAGEDAQSFVERLIVEEGERAIVKAVRDNRQLRGRHIDPRGLDLIRTFRAMALAKMREGSVGSSALPSHDGVFQVFREWGDKRGAGFGVPVYRSSSDHGVSVTIGTLATFVGWTIATQGVPTLAGGTADVYPHYETVPIITLGAIYINVKGAVTDGAAITVGAGGDVADLYGATAADATHIATGWFADETVTDGVCRIVRR